MSGNKCGKTTQKWTTKGAPSQARFMYVETLKSVLTHSVAHRLLNMKKEKKKKKEKHQKTVDLTFCQGFFFFFSDSLKLVASGLSLREINFFSLSFGNYDRAQMHS